MSRTNKDLRFRSPTLGTLDHLGLAIGMGQNVYLRKTDALLGQQTLGCMAIATKRRSVDFNSLHVADCPLVTSNLSVI